MYKRPVMKDYFNEDLAKLYAKHISEIYPEFDKKHFIEDAVKETEDKRMSERIEAFSKLLKDYLPSDYKEATEIIIRILGVENEEFYFPFEKMYYYRALSKYVEMYGLDDFQQSMKTIEEITKRDTAEFAIRPFIKNNYEEVEAVFRRWGQDDNAHLRRLVTEGTRPRLPWAKKLDFINGEVEGNLKLLEPFLNDDSRYVEKSVGNHLNDLSKYDSESVMDFIIQHFEETSPFIIKRALRTLKKEENDRALALLEQLK